MAEIIRHARSVSPWIIPNKGGTAGDIHGLSNVNTATSQSSDDIFVVGKDTRCGVDKGIPEATVTFPQFERGEIDTYLKLANLSAEPVGGLDLLDFSSALVDYFQYERDAFEGNIEQTKWFPKLAISSLSIDIADPEANIERSIELTGDNKFELSHDNKYGIHQKVTFASGDTTIDVSDPAPTIDPNNSGVYILRVDRTRAGETESLTLGTDYTYNNGTMEITITSPSSGDVYNVYYSSDDWGTGGDPTSTDSASPCVLKADSVTVLISDGNEEVVLDKLTSLSLSATITRLDEGVIGSDEKVLREIDETPVDVSLTGRVKNSEILTAFMGHVNDNWGITDINKYLETVRVTVKIYSDETKSTFLIGYQVDGLSFTDDSHDFTAGDFGTMTVNASSDNLLITTTEGDLT